MIKRLVIIIVLSLAAFSLNAQNINQQLTFLGIPVDGTTTDMVSALQNKGFKLENIDVIPIPTLTGKFNGKYVRIAISENYGVVDRICVIDQTKYTESQIKAQFNHLLAQFENNGKYLPHEFNQPIPSDEDISYEMSVHNKKYEAAFYLKPDISDAVEKLKIESDTSSIYKYFYEQKKFQNQMTSVVWFTIQERYGEYQISIYYDNLENRPNGDDL